MGWLPEILQGPATWEMGFIVLYALHILIGIKAVFGAPHRFTLVGKVVGPFIWLAVIVFYIIALVVVVIAFIPLVAGELLAIMIFKNYHFLNSGKGRRGIGIHRFRDDDDDKD